MSAAALGMSGAGSCLCVVDSRLSFLGSHGVCYTIRTVVWLAHYSTGYSYKPSNKPILLGGKPAPHASTPLTPHHPAVPHRTTAQSS
jgi:hypothetical protein